MYRDSVDYEFTIVFDLDIKHYAQASKDRTGLFSDKPEFIITPGVGKQIKEWCNSGTDMEEVKRKIESCTTNSQLNSLFKEYSAYKDILTKDFVQQQEVIRNNKMFNQQKFRQNGTTSS